MRRPTATCGYGSGVTIQLRAVTADDWAEWRVVRLAALADAPGAFGSSYVDWVDASESRWRMRRWIRRASC